MGSHPLNLALRFILELIALAAAGLYGWQFPTPWRYLLAALLPLLLAGLWGIFAVPHDPSRSGRAPVVVSGKVRLLIEGLVFALAVWGLYRSGWVTAAWLFGLVTLGHYTLSLDRLRWLWRSSPGKEEI